MSEMPGMIRPELQALPQIRDRMTFLYFEHCKLNRQDSAITVTDDQGIIHVPAAFLLYLKPLVLMFSCLQTSTSPLVLSSHR